jgi:endonuclease/exonuclease/phosphatase family metal-dependent hydrolase
MGLVVSELLREEPDVIAFQEVALPIRQAHQVAEGVNRSLSEHSYQVFMAEKWGARPEEGIAILTRWPVIGSERLELPEGGRVAQLVSIDKDGECVHVVNTHLHHLPRDEESIRFEQVVRLLDWMFDLHPESEAWILAGDLNATPESETVQAVLARLASAHLSVHGQEPLSTFPTPMVSEEGDFYQARLIDYIFFAPDAFRVQDARLVFVDPHPNDSTLFPSDHYGLIARLARVDA